MEMLSKERYQEELLKKKSIKKADSSAAKARQEVIKVRWL